jgi:hypothetical protein
MEAYGMEPFWQIRMQWGDLFEIEVYLAVTAEQGMGMLRQAMASEQSA